MEVRERCRLLNCFSNTTNPTIFDACSIVKRVFGLVPWGALFACSFLLTGLIIFLTHAKKAGSRSQYVLDLAQSDPSGLYPQRLRVFTGSYAVTAGLAAGCFVASVFLALFRLRQKLAVEKKGTLFLALSAISIDNPN